MLLTSRPTLHMLLRSNRGRLRCSSLKWQALGQARAEVLAPGQASVEAMAEVQGSRAAEVLGSRAAEVLAEVLE